MDTSSFFKYDIIKTFLTEAKKAGNVTSFEKNETATGIIMRHDIDYDMDAALNFMRIEEAAGISSTYFILTSAPFYNINTIANRNKLKKIADAGFEVALHFDPTLYNTADTAELELFADQEAAQLENITGKKIRSVSLHNPSMHNTYPVFKKYMNAYDTKFFSPENYMSDSRMGFRDKIPFEFIKRAKENLLQITLHPFHFSAKGENYNFLFKELISRNLSEWDELAKVNNASVINDLGGKSFIELMK